MREKKTALQVQQAARDDLAAVKLQTQAIPDDVLGLSGVEDEWERRLKIANHYLKRSNMVTLRPILPALLQLKGKPYNLKDHFPFEPLFRTKMPQALLLKTGRQVAKCVRVSDTEVLRLSNGRQINVHELVVGDELLALTENLRFEARKVLAITRSGVKHVIKIRTRLGADFEITGEHRLRVFNNYLPAKELRLGDRLMGVRCGGVFNNAAVRCDRIILTAYMIGDGCCGLSGNWSMTGATGEVIDEFIALVNPLELLGVNINIRGSNNMSVCLHRDNELITWLKEDGLAGKYSYDKRLPGWVFDLSRKNTILFLSRLWATDGMIRDHSSVNKTINISYSTTSFALSRDVRSLLNKLGIPASIKCREAGYTKNGLYFRCRDAYIVRVETRDGWRQFLNLIRVPGKPSIVLPRSTANNNRDTIPIEVNSWIAELAADTKHKHTDSLLTSNLRLKLLYPLSRSKLARYVTYFSRIAPNHPRLPALRNLLDGDVIWDEIISMGKTGEHPTYDIEVEEAHNFVLDGIVSHNSTSLAAHGVILANSIPYFSILYATPLYEMIRRFSHNYVRPFIETSPIRRLFTGAKTINSVLQRSFKNGSMLQFSFCWLDAERVRGLADDTTVLDEIGDMNYDFLPIIHETLSGSPWKLRRYAGTPKSLDNTIEYLWQDSSQAEWVVKCHHAGCGHQNVPVMTHDLVKMIGPWRTDISEERPGIVCAKCRKPVNPRLHGRWIHAYPERRWDFAGYHVPQIIMPMHYNNAKAWDILLGKMSGKGNVTTNVFFNEVCGESYDIGSKLVTVTDIQAAACLPWPNKVEEAEKHLDQYLYRILAVDWGGGGGTIGSGGTKKGNEMRERTSYTVLALLGLRPDGKIDVPWAYKSLRTHDHPYEAKLVLAAMRRFRCSHLAHDYGGAGTIRETMVRQAGLPLAAIVPIAYHPTAKKNIMLYHPPTDDHPRDWYSVDKARSLLLTCHLVKNGTLRFYQDDYRSADDAGLLRDFLALQEEKTSSRLITDVYVITRNRNLSDDFAQAVNIGCMTLFYLHGEWPDLAMTARMIIPPEVMGQFHPANNPDWEDIP